MSEKLPCVFVAEDDEDDQYLLHACFARYSPACRLHFSGNGKDLLTDLAKETVLPNLLLLDLNMPVMDGLEVLAVLRHNPRYAETPIIVLTTSSNPGDQRKAFELGATDFITKPVGQQAMGEIVTRLRNEWLEGKCC